MAEDEAIRISAETMIRAHNGSAASICTETAERWKRRGDPIAQGVWLRILAAVRRLEQEMVSR